MRVLKPSILICLFIANGLLFAQRISYSGNKNKYDNKTGNIELIGNAKLRRQNNQLYASKITIYKEQGYAIATGRVKLINKVDKIRYEGDWLYFDYKNKLIKSKNRPKLHNDREKLTLIADSIHGDLNTDIAHAYSNVHIIDNRNEDIVEIFGDLGTYNKDENLAILDGNGRFKTTNVYGESEKMVYFQKKKLVIMNQSTTIDRINDDGSTNTIKAESVQYDFLHEEEYRCHTNVELIDKKQKNILISDYLRYLPEREYTYMSGNASLESPSNDIIMYSDTFERFEKDEILYAKGNLELVAQERKAYSSIGIYHLGKEEMTLFGHPKVIDNGSTIYAEKIKYDIKKQSFSMENQILGNLSP